MTDTEDKSGSGSASARQGGRIGRYELVEALGKGAMGVVYHAYDALLDRDVALKLMLPQIADEPDQKHRFEREARAVAKLMHPNVVTLFDLGYHTDGSPYLAMELLRGEDLLHTMRAGRVLTLQQKVSVAIQVLDGLAHAHAGGIVHRDIKPANIFLLTDGTVKITDFGVARFTATAASGSGSVVGTVEYMSPEQVQGAQVDGRSDVFSAACVLCELLTGRRPFHADSLVTILYKIAHEAPQLDLPAGLEYERLRPLLEKALRRDPEDRYATAAELATDLRAYLLGLGDLDGLEPEAAAPEAAPDAYADAPSLTSAATAARLQTANLVTPLSRVIAPVPPPPAPPARPAAPPIDPVELFRLMREIYVGGKSGHLHFTCGVARRSLRFVGGLIVMGTSDVPGEHLGNILVRFGLLAQAQLELATEILLRDRKRLGTVLDELGMVTRERMTEAVGLHVREILFNVMDQSGSLGFEETNADAIVGPELMVRIAPGEIVLEATRRIQDRVVIERVVGNMERVLVHSTHPQLRMQKVPFTPTDGFLLSRVDGLLSASEVFQLIPLPHEDVERSLFGLLCTGMLEYQSPLPVRAPGSGGLPRALSFPAAPPREPATAGRPRPGTDASHAGRDLQGENAQVDRVVEGLRRQIVDTYQGLRMKDHFELLGIGREAGPVEVKEAYFRLARPFHPDSHRDLPLGDLAEERHAVFIRLGEAYDTLRHAETRARYERQYAPRAGSRLVMTQPAVTPPAPAPAPPPPAPPLPPSRLGAHFVPEAPPSNPVVRRVEEPPPSAPFPSSPLERAAADIREAEKHVREARYWDAIKLLEPILGHVSGAMETQVHLLLGQSYVKNPNWVKRGADQLQIVIERDPKNAEAHYLLGLIFKNGGLKQRAAAMFRRAVELGPHHAEAQRELQEIEPPPIPPPPKRKLWG